MGFSIMMFQLNDNNFNCLPFNYDGTIHYHFMSTNLHNAGVTSDGRLSVTLLVVPSTR